MSAQWYHFNVQITAFEREKRKERERDASEKVLHHKVEVGISVWTERKV